MCSAGPVITARQMSFGSSMSARVLQGDIGVSNRGDWLAVHRYTDQVSTATITRHLQSGSAFLSEQHCSERQGRAAPVRSVKNVSRGVVPISINTHTAHTSRWFCSRIQMVEWWKRVYRDNHCISWRVWAVGQYIVESS